MSSYKQKFNSKFNQPKDKSNSKSNITKLTGIPKSVLDDVFDRGVGAYKSNPSSVRPSVKSPEQWAYARIYAFVMKSYAGMKGNKPQDMDLYEKIKSKLK